METTGNTTADRPDSLLFVVLIPHRDCLPGLELYRRRLFAMGMDGAFSFPAAAPLALINRPLNPIELKTAAAELRKLLDNKKIISSKESECNGFIHGKLPVRFFGPVLELPLPAFPADAVLYQWEEPILAPVILASGSISPSCDGPVLTQVSRAAALANLVLTPVVSMDNSFTWKFGPLYWLPRKAAKPTLY